MTTLSNLTHLDWLESEAIHILREVAGQCSNPVLLFSGGKDSLCLLRLAERHSGLDASLFHFFILIQAIIMRKSFNLETFVLKN